MWNSGREQEGLTQLQRLPPAAPPRQQLTVYCKLHSPYRFQPAHSSRPGVDLLNGCTRSGNLPSMPPPPAPVLTKQRSCLICILPESPRIIFCATVHRRAQRIGEGEVRHLWVDAPRPSAARDTQWFSGHCGLRSSCSILKWP